MSLSITPSKAVWRDKLSVYYDYLTYPITGVSLGRVYIVEDLSLLQPNSPNRNYCLQILEKGLQEPCEFQPFLQIPFRTLTPGLQHHHSRDCKYTLHYGVSCVSECGNFIFIFTYGYFVSFYLGRKMS